MKKLKEKDFIKELREFYHNTDALTFKINERFSSGFPDLIIIKDGEILFVEVKIEGNKLSPLQHKTLKDIAKHNGKAYVVTKMNSGREKWQVITKEGIIP